MASGSRSLHGYSSFHRLLSAVLSTSAGLVAVQPAAGQTLEQLTDFRIGVSVPALLDSSGATIVYTSTGDHVGANPDHAFQVFRVDTATNSFTQLTSDRVGGGLSSSISDDGQRIAFASAGDLTGQNHDQSTEIFVMLRDGSSVRQLTSAQLGSSSAPIICGDGSRILFGSTADLIGSNPDFSRELFVIDWNGSNLLQLTDSPGDVQGGHLSDDGARIVFGSSEDLTGGNADLSQEIFAILSDGSDLRQLTSAVDASSSSAWIAGDGSLVAFQSDANFSGQNADGGDEIFLLDWTGGTPTQLTNSKLLLGADGVSQAPALDDQAGLVVFHSNQVLGLQNIDANYEIWKINVDGTGLAPLTGTIVAIGSFVPTISGDGGRVAFVSLTDMLDRNADENLEVFSILANGTDLQQHGETIWGFTGGPDISNDGSIVALTSSSDLTGENADLNTELFTVAPDGSGLDQLTSSGSGAAGSPSISDDGGLIAFDSTANYLGGNPDASREVFVTQSDGTGLAQLTSSPLSDSTSPALSGDGQWIAFESEADLLGTNPENNSEIFAMRADGFDLRQLTVAASGSSLRPWTSQDGSRIAFDSDADLLSGPNPEGNREIFIVNLDGSGLTQLTSSTEGASSAASLRADGSQLVFQSSANLTGQNPEGNTEVFRIDADGTNLVQLTATTEGINGGAVFSADGGRVSFGSNSPYAGPKPDGEPDLWQILPDGSGLRRLTAVRRGLAAGASVDSSGTIAVFTGTADFVGDNPDQLPEIFVVDLGGTWQLDVTGKSPTLLGWNATAGAWTYDVARGELSSLSSAVDTIDLGPLVCIEDDSPDLDTLGFEDPDTPTPGSGFFYVVRYSDGINPQSYGTGSGGEKRQPGSGDCVP